MRGPEVLAYLESKEAVDQWSPFGTPGTPSPFHQSYWPLFTHLPSLFPAAFLAAYPTRVHLGNWFNLAEYKAQLIYATIN